MYALAHLRYYYDERVYGTQVAPGPHRRSSTGLVKYCGGTTTIITQRWSDARLQAI